MAAAVLVDSTWFIWHQRRDLDPFVALNRGLGDREALICGMVIFEVLRGARTENVYRRFQASFALMVNQPTTSSTWETSCKIARTLDRRGTPIPPQDSLIAAHALQAGAAVLTLDRHFHVVPGLSVIERLS